FSSRRRHTRSTRDWSSDVCSSDLGFRAAHTPPQAYPEPTALVTGATGQLVSVPTMPPVLPPVVRIISKERFAHPERGKSEQVNRSEERRVGKECRSRGGPQRE